MAKLASCQGSKFCDMLVKLNMEISLVNNSSVKIKGKTASLIIDPSTKSEAEIVIATKALDTLVLGKVDGVRLVISGPGEYEAGGISVTGKNVKGNTLYSIIDSMRILFTTSAGISGVSDDEEYDCLLIEVVGPLKDEDIASINARCAVLFGDLSAVSVSPDKQEKATRVNLKKSAEVAGKIFLLE